MPNLTIKQAAIFCGKDEKTIRRWIVGTAGKNPRPPRIPTHTKDSKGRYLVAQSDLERILAEDAITAVPTIDETRLAALEQRINTLEAMLSKKKTPRATQIAPTHSPLPDGYAALTSWCEAHGIAETTARRYLPPDAVKKGTWTGQDGSLVKVAIDQSGQHHLWEVFHHKTKFKPCSHCPHDELV